MTISSSGIYDDSGAENYCAPCLTDRQISSTYTARTLALFASLDAELTSRLALSAGLRYERWDAQYDDDWHDINYPAVPPQGDSCSQFDCKPGANLWGGHAAISFDFRRDLQGYARVARGFKAGGFNPSLAALQGVAILGPEFIPYRPESLWNYELGLKGLWLDGHLSTDLALFTMRRKNAQLSQSSQQVPFDPNSFVFVTYNGAARVKGMEASAAWQLNPAWQLHGALGLLNFAHWRQRQDRRGQRRGDRPRPRPCTALHGEPGRQLQRRWRLVRPAGFQRRGCVLFRYQPQPEIPRLSPRQPAHRQALARLEPVRLGAQYF